VKLKAATAFSITIAAVVLSSRIASAEVTVTNMNGWELYTTGRVGVFFSTAFGEGNPVPPLGPNGLPVNLNFVSGGGLPIYKDSMGAPLGTQAQFLNMRLRSGFVPNVFAVGLRRKVTDYTTLTAHMALWATVDTEGQRKTENLFAWVQEWYLRLEGPWGIVTGGRALDLFSRGASQNDFMYLHGFGLGFPGNIEANSNGPAAGLIGFGVMAAFFSSGITYATPSRLPLQNTIGVYDPTPLPGAYEATRYPRIEDELTFDLSMPSFKVHLFANGEFQPVYLSGSNQRADSYGFGYGGRAEFGNLHFGVAGHTGRGLGLFYALEPDNVSVSTSTNELRTFDGYSAVAQYVLGRVDLNGGWGISRVFFLDSDNTNPATRNINASSNVSLLKYQMAFAAAIVFHPRDYLHFDIDYMRMQAQYYGAPTYLQGGATPLPGYQAEHQNVNFINAGMTVTW
jgi:hypothetical protein